MKKVLIQLIYINCIIYFMIFNKLLIDKNLKNYNNIENTKINVIKCVEKGIKEINDNQKISKTLKYLTNSLLNPEIKKRISLNELSQNEFLNEGLDDIKKCFYSNYNEHYKTFIELQKIETLRKEKKFLNKKRIFKKFY